MCQPHLLHICIFRNAGRFIKRHMLIFFRLLLLVFLPIHALAYEQIRTGCIIFNRICRAGICTIGNLNPLSRRPQHHIRRINIAVRLHCLPFLQHPPVLLQNARGIRPLHIELACAVYFHCIAVAWHIVVHAECFQPIAIYLKRPLGLIYLDVFYRERKLRRDDPQGIYYTLQPFWPDEGQRLRAIRVPHSKEKPRQPADMIAMIMGKAYYVQRFEAPPLLLDRNLCPFPAINQHAAAVVTHHQRREPTIRQRHHPSCS